MADIERTTPHRPWLFKMFIFIAAAGGLGLWGVYDAVVVYPQRGEAYASWTKWEFLQQADANRRLTLRELEDADPAATLEQLLARNQSGTLSEFDTARTRWYQALDVIQSLSADQIRARLGDDPRQTLSELETKWQTASAPKSLSAYDIPVQWGIAAVGLGTALIIILHTLRVMSVKYGWNEEALELALPGGQRIKPEHLADVDKRKWHKFIVFLKINDTHPTLAGQTLKLDLYQHAKLESWVLQMERVAFPDRAEDPAEDQTEGSGDSDQPADHQLEAHADDADARPPGAEHNTKTDA